MSTKIEALTPEQEARLPEFREKWRAIAMSTEPADRSRTEEAIERAYQCAGFKPPKRVVWGDSPSAMCLLRDAEFSHLESDPYYVPEEGSKLVHTDGWVKRVPTMDPQPIPLGGTVEPHKTGLSDLLSSAVRSAVEAYLSDDAVNSVQDAVWNPVFGGSMDLILDKASLAAGTRRYVWENSGRGMFKPLFRRVRDGLVFDLWHGQDSAHKVAALDYCREVLGLTAQTKTTAGLIEQAKHGGWILAYKHVCYASERHSLLKLDERGRLHCENGPAFGYSDGWNTVYFIHGVRVDEHVVMEPQRITLDEVQHEWDLERRRVLISRYGLERYISDTGTEKMHEDDWGTLYRRKGSDGDEPLVWVRVVNATPEPDGTFRDYWLRVPPTLQTALEAVAWTFEKSPEEYRRLVAQS